MIIKNTIYYVLRFLYISLSEIVNYTLIIADFIIINKIICVKLFNLKNNFNNKFYYIIDKNIIYKFCEILNFIFLYIKRNIRNNISHCIKNYFKK